MSVIMQISDPHFGTEQPQVMAGLTSLVKQQKPNLLVLSGDITQRARPAQFHAARRFMDSLHVPFLAIPGNHDIPLLNIWSRLSNPYARHIAAFGSELEPFYSSPDMMIICVNTTRAWRHKHGELSAQQIARVTDLLSQASAEQLRIIVVHQPIAVTRAKHKVHLLRGHSEALPAWSAAGADLVMGGHIHLPYVLPLAGLARPTWAVQAGTAVSSRVRSGVPNSVNILRWGVHAKMGGCHIEQWDFSAKESNFEIVKLSEVHPLNHKLNSQNNGSPPCS
ncbi:metallophosphoesterase family protein [Undibacterium sp. Di24W]|uniref:metallophosphoesterase family protein n=1 Tax=Undibacterium sp. Di24W TaxID=3413033 RepID=UPI003BF2853F